MPLLLVLIFIVVPIAELALLIQVGQLIGVWWTIGLLIADALLGSWLLRAQGRVAWRRFNEALAQGRVPHREVVDGVLVIFGGVLLMTPGFITDVFGLLFLIPPTRVLMRRLLVRRGALKLVSSMPGTGSRNGRPHDIEGSAVDIDPPQLWARAGSGGPCGGPGTRTRSRSRSPMPRRACTGSRAWPRGWAATARHRPRPWGSRSRGATSWARSPRPARRRRPSS